MLILEELQVIRSEEDKLGMPFVVRAVQDVFFSDWREGQLSIPHLYWRRGGIVACGVMCGHGGWVGYKK
jgi:hypothetical protein